LQSLAGVYRVLGVVRKKGPGVRGTPGPIAAFWRA
jgi:hypothetical protein